LSSDLICRTSRIATTTSKEANSTFETVSDIRAEIHPPTMADGIPESPTVAAARKSTFFFVRFRYVPMMDVGMMTKTDVPFAMAAGKCNNIIIAGTMMMPPPTPSNPARIPVATPIAIKAITLPTVNTPRVPDSIGRNSRTAVTKRMPAKAIAKTRCGKM
jgi:hypothetical protein